MEDFIPFFCSSSSLDKSGVCSEESTSLVIIILKIRHTYTHTHIQISFLVKKWSRWLLGPQHTTHTHTDTDTETHTHTYADTPLIPIWTSSLYNFSLEIGGYGPCLEDTVSVCVVPVWCVSSSYNYNACTCTWRGMAIVSCEF